MYAKESTAHGVRGAEWLRNWLQMTSKLPHPSRTLWSCLQRLTGAPTSDYKHRSACDWTWATRRPRHALGEGRRVYSEGRHRGEQHARSGQSKAQVKSTEQVECDEGHATERDRGMPGRVRPVRVLECLRNGGKRAGEKRRRRTRSQTHDHRGCCLCVSLRSGGAKEHARAQRATPTADKKRGTRDTTGCLNESVGQTSVLPAVGGDRKRAMY